MTGLRVADQGQLAADQGKPGLPAVVRGRVEQSLVDAAQPDAGEARGAFGIIARIGDQPRGQPVCLAFGGEDGGGASPARVQPEAMAQAKSEDRKVD